MAAQEGPQESYEEFVSQILRPTNLASLKGSYESVQVMVFTDQGEPSEVLEFDNIYPFHTIADLCTRIYIEKELKEDFHPQNQCLLTPIEGGSYLSFRYLLGENNLILENPYKLIKGRPDSRFVDATGQRKQVKIVRRDEMLLEKTLFVKPSDTYVLHLYLYRDVLAAYTGLRPINRVDWEGKMLVYYPEYLKAQEDGSLSEAVEEYIPSLTSRFQERLNIIEVLEGLLQDKPLRKPGETMRGDAVDLANVRNLRFSWKRPSKSPLYEQFHVETVFYDMPVSDMIPYIRYYPKTKTPLSKINVEGVSAIPTMEEPEILLKWVQDRTLTPNEDLLMAKVVVRPGSGSVNPLYGTFFLFEEGSAKFIIQPNLGEKALTKQGDLYDLPNVIGNLLKTIPMLNPKSGVVAPPKPIFTRSGVMLEDAYIVLSLWLERDDTNKITEKSLNKVLPFFRPFFQVTTSPISDQNPIMFLRYKCVNDFQTPSRDFQFLQRIIDLQKLSGKTSIRDLLKFYKEEFEVPDGVAEQRVTSFLENTTKFSLVNPETLEYTQTDNPGIDIAIFGRHPFYNFHIYRVDSLETLRRIKTLLSLLVSVDASEFTEVVRSARGMEEDEAADVDAAEAVAAADAAAADAGPGVASPLAAAAAAAAGTEGADAEFELDQLGDFAGFGENSPGEGPEPPTVPLKTLIAADAAAPAAARHAPLVRLRHPG